MLSQVGWEGGGEEKLEHIPATFPALIYKFNKDNNNNKITTVMFLMFFTICVKAALSLFIKTSCRSSVPLPLVGCVFQNWLREALTQPNEQPVL